MLVAILPGLYALQHWDLTLPGPWWGMRGLAVLEGHWIDQSPLSGLGPKFEAISYKHVSMQPPIYAWLEAAALWLSGQRVPLATVVPSYIAGMVLVLLIYELGRLWGKPSLGLIAAAYTGFNAQLLMHMQHANPATLGLAFTLATLWTYTRASRSKSPRRRIAWGIASGLCLGSGLLSIGILGLSGVVVVVGHRLLIGTERWPKNRPLRWRIVQPMLAERATIGLLGVAAVVLGLSMAAPWYAWMAREHGLFFWSHVFAVTTQTPSAPDDSLGHLLLLSPPTVVLGALGAWRAARRLARSERGSTNPQRVGDALWIAWLLTALAGALIWPGGATPLSRLFFLAPLNLLAAQTTLDLGERRLSSRALIGLAPLTALAVLWWILPELRLAFDGVFRGRRPSPGMTLALHLGLDLLVILALVIRGFDRWTSSNDRRRRLVIGAYLCFVMLLSVCAGLREVTFRHRETTDLLALRDSIVRRQAQRPFAVLAVVSSDEDPTVESDSHPGNPLPLPGGRLRFILRSALPDLAQIDVAHVQDLQNLPDTDRLVVLAGTGARLTYALQSRLRLEVLHPGLSGLLAAYGTPVEPQRIKTAHRALNGHTY
jgi:4-amino-4-deoxy-L-arabinose transferase-like glycosyltransferase